MIMDTPDWGTAEYLAHLSAEELAQAMAHVGIDFFAVTGDDDGIRVAFANLKDAEALMTLAVESSQQLGSLYDRATTHCLTFTNAAEEGRFLSDGEVEQLFDTGWDWKIHPAMRGRRMDWHVAVTIPHQDAYQLTVNLNAQRLGGAV